ncbi:MAG: hypothetical protein ABIP42_07340 [Planctomycetota bacterium]
MVRLPGELVQRIGEEIPAGLEAGLGLADQALFDPRGLLAAGRKSGRFLC